MGAERLIVPALTFGALFAAAKFLLTRSSQKPGAVRLEAPDGEPESFPSAGEVMTQGECVAPHPRPGVEAFRDYVIRTWGGTDLGIWRECSRGGASEHKVGRGWDWGIKPGPEADALIAWLSADDWAWGRRLGVGIVIYNRKIWSAWKRADGWRTYEGPDPHNTHIHLSFSERAARGETSGYKALAEAKKGVA